ncbi:hypothetical protein Hanom_Chr17g01546901 [Helianthus anomalus]
MFNILLIYIRVKCHFSPCGLSHFVSLVQRFHFSPVGSKKFHRCHLVHLVNLSIFSVNGKGNSVILFVHDPEFLRTTLEIRRVL